MRSARSFDDEGTSSRLESNAAAAKRYSVLETSISAINPQTALSVIGGWLETGAREYVCVTSVHGVMECRRDPVFREAVNRAGMVTPDGMPLVWAGRLLGVRGVGRVYGPNLMENVCRLSAERGWAQFLYGGAPGVAEELARTLQARYPGLRIAGVFAPPFGPVSPEADAEHVRRINESGADVVWVGLGAPKQELWMAAHRPALRAGVLVGVGAAFDFLSGRKPQAPRWMQSLALEWLFRLMTEPRRLWKRYLTNNPAFLFLFFLQLLTAKLSILPARIKKD